MTDDLEYHFFLVAPTIMLMRQINCVVVKIHVGLISSMIILVCYVI